MFSSGKDFLDCGADEVEDREFALWVALFKLAVRPRAAEECTFLEFGGFEWSWRKV